MASWIVQYSADPVPAAVHPVLAGLDAPTTVGSVAGFAEVMSSAHVASTVVDDLLSDIVALGAVNVKELDLADWRQLPSWKKLRTMEVRRLVAVLSAELI